MSDSSTAISRLNTGVVNIGDGPDIVGLSMEFDIVDRQRKRRWKRYATVDGVRHCWTWKWKVPLWNSTQASMEFDIVELQSWNDRTRKKFADQAERRKSRHQLSLCEKELAMCCITGSTASQQTTMIWVERSV